MRYRRARIQPGRACKKIEDKPAKCGEDDPPLSGCPVFCGIAPLVECRVDERPESDEEPDDDELKRIPSVPRQMERRQVVLKKL